MFTRIGIILLGLMLIGCAGTRTLVNNDYLHSVEDRFEIEIINSANATDAGLSVFQSQLATYNTDLKIGDPSPNRRVTIEFTNYYVRGGATRALAGIMAGSDNVTTITKIEDTATGELLGSVQHTTKNPTAVIGINSLIKGHADKVASFLLSRKK